MNKVESSITQFLIVAGTSMMVLFTGEGVARFSDIAEVQYATAIIGAIVAVAKDLHSWKQPPQ